MIPRGLGWNWVSSSTPKFWGINTGQPDLFSCARSAGIAVVTGADRDHWQRRNGSSGKQGQKR
jgi:hypothetical protein